MSVTKQLQNPFGDQAGAFLAAEVRLAPKAMKALAAVDLLEARARAAHVLERASRCDCCRCLLGHVFARLGSTLFLDDDPEALAQAFEADERDPYSPQVIAACILLSGRERVRPPNEAQAAVGDAFDH